MIAIGTLSHDQIIDMSPVGVGATALPIEMTAITTEAANMIAEAAAMMNGAADTMNVEARHQGSGQ